MDDLITTAVAKLTQAGLHCCAAFPDFRLPQLSAPMVVVSLCEFALCPAVYDCYVGLDSSNVGFCGERFDGTLRFDIYTPFRSGGRACIEAAHSVMQVLRSGFEGYTLRTLSGTSAVYTPESDCFQASVCAELSAWYCRAEEE